MSQALPSQNATIAQEKGRLQAILPEPHKHGKHFDVKTGKACQKLPIASQIDSSSGKDNPAVGCTVHFSAYEQKKKPYATFYCVRHYEAGEQGFEP
jgi:hypothetical protein